MSAFLIPTLTIAYISLIYLSRANFLYIFIELMLEFLSQVRQWAKFLQSEHKRTVLVHKRLEPRIAELAALIKVSTFVNLSLSL